MKLISSSLSHFFIPYLIVFLIVAPIPRTALASQTPTVAVIEMIDSNKLGPAGSVREQVEKTLSKSTQVQLIPRDQIVSYYKNKPASFERTIATTPKTEADLLYDQVEDLFMGFKNNEAMEHTSQAIAALKQTPGIRNNLLNTYFIMTQIYWELGKQSEARKCLEEAAKLSVDEIDLDDYMWSPNLQAAFNSARVRYAAQNKTTELVVQVKGNKQAPIFVNGIFRGYGPRLALKIATDTPQLVSVGTNPKATPVISYGGTLELSDKTSSTKTIAGIAKKFEIQTAAVELGQAVGADQVIVVGVLSYKAEPTFQWALFDVKRNVYLKGDTMPFNSSTQDIARAATVVARSVSSPEAAGTYLAQANTTTTTTTQTQKLSAPKAKSKMFIYIAAGLVAVGAGTVLAMSLGGGNDSAPSTANIGISGPVADVP
jgi:tetratricopeptide (TPR) repeat protein